MSSGKAAARDTRHGRRGGGWIEGDPNERPRAVDAPRCPVCDLPMMVGQRNGHGVCVGIDEAFAVRKASKGRR